jgi:hypothetical protein
MPTFRSSYGPTNPSSASVVNTSAYIYGVGDLIVFLAAWGGTATPPTISDNYGHIWTPLFNTPPQDTDNGLYIQAWSTYSTVASTSITVTHTYSITITYPYMAGWSVANSSGAAITAQFNFASAASPGVPGSAPDISGSGGGIFFGYTFIANVSLSTPTGWTLDNNLGNYHYLYHLLPSGGAANYNTKAPGASNNAYASVIFYMPPAVPSTISGLDFDAGFGIHNALSGGGHGTVLANGGGGGASAPTIGQIYPQGV